MELLVYAGTQGSGIYVKGTSKSPSSCPPSYGEVPRMSFSDGAMINPLLFKLLVICQDSVFFSSSAKQYFFF
jgi:hypothetical protein